MLILPAMGIVGEIIANNTRRSLLMTLWGASIRFTTPMLFALAFLPMFGIGGLTGLPLGLAPLDLHLHDTCSQLCRLGHYRMRGFLNVKTEAEYQAYLAQEAQTLQP